MKAEVGTWEMREKKTINFLQSSTNQNLTQYKLMSMHDSDKLKDIMFVHLHVSSSVHSYSIAVNTLSIK